MIPGVGYGTHRTEIDVAVRQHAIEVGGYAGEQVHPRPAGAIDAPFVGKHAGLLKAVIERVAVEKLDVSDPDRHAWLPCGGPPGLGTPDAAAGAGPPGTAPSASS